MSGNSTSTFPAYLANAPKFAQLYAEKSGHTGNVQAVSPPDIFTFIFKTLKKIFFSSLSLKPKK